MPIIVKNRRNYLWIQSFNIEITNYLDKTKIILYFFFNYKDYFIKNAIFNNANVKNAENAINFMSYRPKFGDVLEIRSQNNLTDYDRLSDEKMIRDTFFK